MPLLTETQGKRMISASNIYYLFIYHEIKQKNNTALDRLDQIKDQARRTD